MPLTKFGEHAFLLEVATDLMDDSKSSAGSVQSQQVGGATCSISVNLSLRSDTVPGRPPLIDRADPLPPMCFAI
eukprot:1217970-Amphidinium_carterae.1